MYYFLTKFVSIVLCRSYFLLFLFTPHVLFANQSIDSFDANSPDFKTASQTQTKSTNNVQYLHENSGISVLDFSGDYNLTSESLLNTAARIDVTQELYSYNPDQYDFIVVFTTFPIESNELSAFATVIKNDVAGIGKELFDNSNQFGSEKLQLLVDMKNINNWSFDPNNSDFAETTNTLMHEIMHRWGISVKFMDANSQISEELLGNAGVHWSYFFNSNASVMYGSLWQDLANGSFKSIKSHNSLSPLDLYLANNRKLKC